MALSALILLRADMYQDASNAQLPEAQQNLGFMALCGGTVTCDGVTDDSAAINLLLAAKPAVYTIARGKTIALGSSINFRSNHTGLVCEGGNAAPLAGSAAMQGCAILKWTGAAGGIVVGTRPTPGGPAGNSIIGLKFAGLGIQCDGTTTAAVGIEAVETSLSTFNNLFFRGCSEAGIKGGDLPTTTAANFRKNEVVNIECSVAANLPGDCFKGYTSASSLNSDVNTNEFRFIRGRLGRGNAVSIYGSDSNVFYNISSSHNGTDTGGALIFGSSRNAIHPGNNSNIVLVAEGASGKEGDIIVGGTGGDDGVCTGTAYTSVSGAFNEYDIGAAITGTNLAGGTTVAAIVTARKVTLSQACTADGSGLTFAIAGRTASTNISFINHTANNNKLPTAGTGANFVIAPFVDSVSTTSASYAIAVNQNGATFDNAGATAEVALRLPVAKVGMRYCFTNVVGVHALRPFPREGEVIQLPIIGDTTSAQPFSTTVPGASACLAARRVGNAVKWTVASMTPGWLDTTVAAPAVPAVATGTVAANAVTGSISPNAVTGSIAGTTLTVSAVASGGLVPGQTIACAGCLPATTVVQQLTGTTRGVGTYEVTPEQEVSSTAMTPSGGWLTVTAVASGGVGQGQALAGAGITGGTTVLAGGPTGGVGGYPVNISQTAASTAIVPSGGFMNVTAVTSGLLNPGAVISGIGITAGNEIDVQMTGSAGGVGTYLVSVADTAGPTTITTTRNMVNLLTSDSGKSFNTSGSTIEVRFRLPIAAAGLRYCFTNGTSSKIAPLTRVPNLIYVNGVSDAAGYNTTQASATLCLSAQNIAGALAWVAVAVSGTWVAGL